jgi:hypothetical protein
MPQFRDRVGKNDKGYDVIRFEQGEATKPHTLVANRVS